MISWLKVILKAIKVFLLFTGFTILFYLAIMWFNEEYEGYHRYDEPEGKAVKAAALAGEEENSLFDRLILFYLTGE
ncbi:YqzK family protein [Bacillaceae bacterium Marseille-Q3522]|nr:YqzK family protein [Bacillaceae bacterium Marseille-Q3522]